MNKRRLTTGSNGLLHVQDVRRVFIKTTTKKPKKKKKMAPNIIAFSTVTKRQLRYKQMLMTYKQYNTQVF